MNEVWKKPPVSLDAYQGMVGEEIGVSSWHLVDQKRINTYADVIEDHQFIHVDPERARRETAFGSTVAHGFLTMSLMSIMSYEVMPVIEGTTMGVNYGFDKLRFISPVRAGSRVRGRFVLAEAKLRKPKELQSRTNVTVEIEGDLELIDVEARAEEKSSPMRSAQQQWWICVQMTHPGLGAACRGEHQQTARLTPRELPWRHKRRCRLDV